MARGVRSSQSDPDQARALHADAHHMCNIASSVNFTVDHEPESRVGE